MENIALLQKSFESFNKATSDLQRAYARLEDSFAGLNKELEAKNAELIRTVAEKEQTKNYLQNILESLINGVIVTDLNGKIQTMNRCAEVFAGVTQTEAFGLSVNILFDDKAIDDWLSVNPAEYYKGESGYKVKAKDRTLEIFCSPFKSLGGLTIGNVYILRDITRIEKLEDMAKRTEKFSAMGEMAANIAHEIRNPLGSIELFASLLLKNLQEKKSRECVVQIISSVKNVDNKISNLLMFTRKQNPVMKKIDLCQVLAEVISFSEQIMEQGDINVTVKYADSQTCIDGDAEMIKQVFLNIILNAQQAMPEGGELSIRLANLANETTQGQIPIAEIVFRDSGPGIPKENLGRVFDPFFSTKEGGAGLGLAIVHNIISEHNGSITIENSPEGGTVVNVGFPLLMETNEKREKLIK